MPTGEVGDVLAWTRAGAGDLMKGISELVLKAKQAVLAAVPMSLRSPQALDKRVDRVLADQLAAFAELGDGYFECLLDSCGSPEADKLRLVTVAANLILANLMPRLERPCPAVMRVVRAEKLI